MMRVECKEIEGFDYDDALLVHWSEVAHASWLLPGGCVAAYDNEGIHWPKEICLLFFPSIESYKEWLLDVHCVEADDVREAGIELGLDEFLRQRDAEDEEEENGEDENNKPESRKE